MESDNIQDYRKIVIEAVKDGVQRPRVQHGRR